MDFEVSLTTTTAGMSFDSTTTTAATTAATTTAPTTCTAKATTTAVTTYTLSLDISILAIDLSPVTLLFETQSHLSREFFSDKPGRSLQEAIEITVQKHAPESQTNVALEIGDLFGDSSNTATAHVVWLSNFAGRKLDKKMLKQKWHNDFFNTLDSSGRVWEMIKQHHSAQQRKPQAMKKPGDLWQHYFELQGILDKSSGSAIGMRLTAITNQISKNPMLAERHLNHAYVNCLTKLNCKSKANKWYTSAYL